MTNTPKIIETRTMLETYKDFVDNFLTVKDMAEYYGIDSRYLENIIYFGKVQHRYKQFCKVAKNWKR